MRDYKETLLLPKTKFPMRGNLPKNEPKRYKRWFEQNIYQFMKEQRKGAPTFNLHDGPPYANGHIHIGHALNKILKDFIVKLHYFQGYDVRFVPGWDCHGLPIERKVEEQIGRERKEQLPKVEVRELCRRHAAKFIEIQREEFKSLGVIADWDHPYKTMDFKFEGDIFRALAKIAEKGYLVERNKPVYWCLHDKTALAEAEVEYYPKEDYSIFVLFPLSSDSRKKLEEKVGKGLPAEVGPVIWTTTPWTLPANMAISLSPDHLYSITSDGKIVAQPLLPRLREKGVVTGEEIATIPGKELEGLTATNPLNGRSSLLLTGDHVSMEDGTGAVHTAPGHGEEDYFIWLQKMGEGEILQPVDSEGRYTRQIVKEGLLPEEFVGVNIFEAQPKILELLGEKLLKVEKFTHNYPHCWRCKNPVIFRATKQFFIAMDKEVEGETLRSRALKGIEKVHFTPATGKNRLRSMVEKRPDWCISRQRDWGVPIAFFRNKETGQLLIEPEVNRHIAAIFDKEGADAWWTKSVEELLPPSFRYLAPQLEKVEDILDVWFDSGSTWFAVLKSGLYDAGQYPASLYLEGSDQHRGWFQSSLLVSSAIEGVPPYRGILTHGFTVDEQGEKMSKSKGNVVSPAEVTRKLGSEILRLWVANSDYTGDIKLGQNILKQMAEHYRKIRNTIRYLLANTDDLPTDDPVVTGHSLPASPIDRWILARSGKLFEEILSLFKRYEFGKGMGLLNNFIVSELSGIYLEVVKDRLYCEARNSRKRRDAQGTMALITNRLLTLLAPILTYTTDEAVEFASEAVTGGAKTIFEMVYRPLPQLPGPIPAEIFEIRKRFFEEVDRLKKEKKISTTLELVLETNYYPLLEEAEEMADLFLVSKIVDKPLEGEPLAQFHWDDMRFVVKLYPSPLSKCPRCWRYLAPAEGELCGRCAEVVEGRTDG
jgi:isoleucyl-tRNA synthetase